MDVVREKAKKDYMAGLKYKDICQKYDLSMNTLKSWVKRYNWADERKNKGKKGAHKKKRGAPKGNKNAVGNAGGPGGPPGNKKAVKHGVYETVIRDRLTPEEQAVFDALPAEDDLTQEIRILRFKLLRLLEPVEREAVVGTKEGAEVVTLKVDEVTKAYAVEKLVDGIRKLVKEMRDTGQDDGGLELLADAIAKSAKALGGDGA